jgi:hypothetical protein
MNMRACLAAALVIFTGATTCVAGDIRLGGTTAVRIARDASIPGKGKAGECMPFALALQKRFEAAGIPSRVIVFGYEQAGVSMITVYGDVEAQPSGQGAARGSHVMVVYDDGGRTYAMDNQSWTPRWIREATPVQMAQQFSGVQCDVKMARVLPTRRAPGHTGSNTRLATN